MHDISFFQSQNLETIPNSIVSYTLHGEYYVLYRKSCTHNANCGNIIFFVNPCYSLVSTFMPLRKTQLQLLEAVLWHEA